MKKTAWTEPVAVLLILAVLFGGCSVQLDTGDPLILRCRPYPEETETEIVCNRTGEDEYCLFLPADADRAALYVEYEGGRLLCGDEAIPNGAVTDLLGASGELTLTRSGRSYTLRVMQSENLPAVFISSEKDLSWLHEDRDNKSPGRIVISENGKTVTQTGLKHIKGRGNSTWNLEEWKPGSDKRPYNIKLEEEQSLLGMTPAKKWRLLANALDRYYVKNEIGLRLAREIGVSAALDCRPVDLYINGDYRGNYLMTESIDPGEGHVPVNDTQKLNEEANAPALPDVFPWQSADGADGGLRAQWRELPKTPSQSEWAYLVELIDKNIWNEEFSYFYTEKNNWYEMKNPEDASEAQVRYAAEVFDRAEEALYAEDGRTAEGRYYSELVDTDSLARAWLVHEVTANVVACHESTFHYLPQGSETVFTGPVWDFDQTIGGSTIDDWQVCNSGFGGVNWFCAAFRHADFRALAAEIWSAFCETHSPQTLGEWVGSLCRNITASVVMDQYRWGEQGSSPETSAEAYLRICAKLSQELSSRAARLTEGLSEENALLWFVSSENDFYLYPDLVPLGGTAVIPSGKEDSNVDGDDDLSMYGQYLFGKDGLLYWAERPDGSGARYSPGDTVRLTDRETVLYAVYGEKTP